MTYDYDAVVVGAGPNGLAAAITLARAGASVLVMEGADEIGGGTRTAELTLPGFRHDICSAIHPLGVGSPFFEELPLSDHGLAWIHPDLPVAHPLDDGTAAFLTRSVEETSAALDDDSDAYRRLMAPYVHDWEKLMRAFLGPLRVPRYPIVMARFGLQAIRSTEGLVDSRFSGTRARALFAGLAGHAIQPLEKPPTAAFGLVLGLLGHAVGWPMPQGGAQRIAEAMANYLRTLDGEIVTGEYVDSLDDIPNARAVMLDITPRQFLSIAGNRLSGVYRRQLEHYRYGAGVFKLDLALDGPIPWTAEACRRAGTIHVGGTFEEIATAERMTMSGWHPERPLVLLAQQSLFDETRAPDGKHTVWAYCHVPHGSTVDMAERIERQIERFAPGFRDRILARHTMTTVAMEEYNPNYVGGDINGGVQDLRQLFTRPAVQLDPYATPIDRVYLCSSATPPGGGVHGMCGYHAAKSALKWM